MMDHFTMSVVHSFQPEVEMHIFIFKISKLKTQHSNILNNSKAVVLIAISFQSQGINRECPAKSRIGQM